MLNLSSFSIFYIGVDSDKYKVAEFCTFHQILYHNDQRKTFAFQIGIFKDIKLQ